MVIHQDVVDFCMHQILAFIWSLKMYFGNLRETDEGHGRYGIP